MKSHFLFVSLFISCISLHAQTKFFEGGLEKAMDIASYEQKYLFIDCYTDWCGWCKVADEKTFANEEVGAFMNERFISVKIDMERGGGIELGAKYRVFGYPSYLIFTPDGSLARKFSGYMSDPMDFVIELKSALDESSHPKYPLKLKENAKLPDFYLNSFANADTKEKRVNPDPEVIEKWLIDQTDLTSVPVWSVISKFEVNEKMTDQFVDSKEKFEAIYGEIEVEQKIGNIAYSQLRKAIESKSEKDLESVLEFVRKHMTINTEENISFYRLKFYEGTENWPAYVELVQQIILEKGHEGQSEAINNYCWTIYENVEDPELLKLAGKWMHTVVNNDPEYMYLDTYAALLFKMRMYKEAITWAETAIQAGKKFGQNVAETEALLEKIRTAMKDR